MPAVKFIEWLDSCVIPPPSGGGTWLQPLVALTALPYLSPLDRAAEGIPHL
jgi:hypothetical protein